MSVQFFKNDVIFYQRILAVSGFYAGSLDGKWTAAVDQAEDVFDANTAKLRKELGEFDKRSERQIETLIPTAQKLARKFLTAAAAFSFDVRLISGTRTYAEQDALYAIGRTVQKNRSPVTKAKGGQSNHNFSIAWDVGLFDKSGHYLTGASRSEAKAYRDLAVLIKQADIGLEWGGDWTSFVDAPHYQVATGRTLKEIRTLFEAGKPFVA